VAGLGDAGDVLLGHGDGSRRLQDPGRQRGAARRSRSG
jgi:hypothetical protein